MCRQTPVERFRFKFSGVRSFPTRRETLVFVLFNLSSLVPTSAPRLHVDALHLIVLTQTGFACLALQCTDMPLSASDALLKGAATTTTIGVGLLAVMATPPVAARLVRFKMPNSWCFYGPIMFAKPVAAGVLIATPFAASYHYNTSRCAEQV
jgi:multidrug transporter EmrE-like cation transporter